MSKTYFKANSRKTGSLVKISVASKNKDKRTGEEREGSVYYSIVKQTGWDDSTKRGRFSGGQSLNIKFNSIEISNFIRVINERDNDRPAKIFHAFGDSKVNGQFGYYSIEGKSGFSLGLNSGNDKFRVSFTEEEAEDLKAWLDFCRLHIFEGLLSIERNKLKAINAKKSLDAPRKNTKVDDDVPDFGKEQSSSLEDEEDFMSQIS